MLNKRVHPIFLVFLLAVLLSTSACTQKSALTSKTPLTVSGSLDAAGAKTTNIVEAHIVISRNKHVIEEKVPLINNEFVATLLVPVGEWSVAILLIDAEGIVHFQSKPETIQIEMGKPKLLDLVLKPANRKVQININLDNYIFKQVAMRARIHFDEIYYEVTRENSLAPFETELDIAPGSYEFKIELYTESFRVGDRLGLGVWEIVHISENEDFTIDWSPVTQELHVTGRVENLLPAPEKLSLTKTEAGIVVSWEPVDCGDVVGYFILAQLSPLERFELLTSVPIEEHSYLHEIDSDHISDINYVATAVSSSGHVGYYSDMQTWQQKP